MNTDAIRHFYGYHFDQNRRLWNAFIARLTPEQYTRDMGYSHGSVRDQIVQPDQC
ncbi:MAG: hypothetical protein GX495_13290 [Chloroflexi bacterium]|jgi:uncharacterized damage-inducible protein DinB|nr:hypothetical protein [Chloroflexota bacterium]